jgi:D-arginine dehydrogenase
VTPIAAEQVDAVDVVDVVVVGAGIAGSAAAAELAPTRRVVLVEQEHLPAQHASGRSASVLSETSGHPVVCGLARLSRRYFEQPPEGAAEHALLSPRGLVWVGEAGDVDLLDRLAERAVLVAPTARRLDAAETRALLPTFADEAIAGGAVHEPDAMSIDTAAVIDGHLRIMRRHGGRLVADAEVMRIERLADDTWLVGTAAGTFQARHVVDAAGAWADVVAARAGLAPIGLVAMRRTAAISPAPDDVAGWPLVMDVAGRYYCEPEPGGLLISPADETPTAPCDAQADELDVALALERVRDATRLPLRAVRRAWAGLRTFAPDRVPVLGEDPLAPGFWWLAGQGGAGIKTAPAMAQLLARLLDGADFPDDAVRLGITPEALSPARFR